MRFRSNVTIHGKRMPQVQLNSRLLECFHATMAVGTVTGAAEILNTSQPAVSRSLKQLEDAVKMSLFNRSGNRVIPTQEAYLLFEEVDKSFRSIRRIGRAAEEIQKSAAGKNPHCLRSGLLAGLIGICGYGVQRGQARGSNSGSPHVSLQRFPNLWPPNNAISGSQHTRSSQRARSISCSPMRRKSA